MDGFRKPGPLKDLYQIRFAAALFLLFAAASNLCFGVTCPFVALTGFPCPGCGLSRALYSLLRGHFSEAFAYNGMIYLWVPAFSVLALKRYTGRFEKVRWEAVIIPLLLLTLAYYIFRLRFSFPGETPMTYHPNNLTAWFLKHPLRPE